MRSVRSATKMANIEDWTEETAATIYSEAVKAILRSNPKVVFLGEMRGGFALTTDRCECTAETYRARLRKPA